MSKKKEVTKPEVDVSTIDNFLQVAFESIDDKSLANAGLLLIKETIQSLDAYGTQVTDGYHELETKYQSSVADNVALLKRVPIVVTDKDDSGDKNDDKPEFDISSITL